MEINANLNSLCMFLYIIVIMNCLLRKVVDASCIFANLINNLYIYLFICKPIINFFYKKKLNIIYKYG